MAASDNIQATSDTVAIGVVAVDGCLTVAVAGLVDVFAVANYWRQVRTGCRARRFAVQVLAARAGGVRSFTGYPVADDGGLAAWTGGDVLIVSAVATDPAREVERNPALIAWLAAQARDPRVTLASVCTGAFFLAEAGLLRARRATTNPLFAPAFVARYPDVELDLARVVVDDGPVLTSGTVAAGLNLALYVVERYAGAEVAALTARALAVDKNRESQAPYLIPARRVDAGDELAARAQRWLEAHHADPALALPAAARALATTARTLQRRFLAATGDTPADYLRRVRLESAKRLLEGTGDSIDAITAAVGYRDARSFARLFRAHTSLSPAEYRARFGPVRTPVDARPGASARRRAAARG